MSSRFITSVAASAMLAGASTFVSMAVPQYGVIQAAQAQSATGSMGSNSTKQPATGMQPKNAAPGAQSNGTASQGAMNDNAGKTFITMQDASDFSANRFIGHSVMNAGGKSVGDINDLIFSKQGKVTAAVVGVGGFLGIGEKNVAVAMNKIDLVRDPQSGNLKLTTSLTKDQLKNAPQFKTMEAQLSQQRDNTVTGSTPMPASPASPSTTGTTGQ